MYNWFQWRTVLLIIESILHNSISFYPPKYIRSNGTQSNGPYIYIIYVLLFILFKMRENVIWVRFYSQQIPIVGCWCGRGGEIPNYTKKYYRFSYTHVLWRVKVKGLVGGRVDMGVVENELRRRQSSGRILKTQTASTNHWKCCGFALTLTHADLSRVLSANVCSPPPHP